MPRLKLFFHDACFDGTGSAALFSAFYRAREAGAVIEPVGMQHSTGDPFDGVVMDADDHACVDFRYTSRPQLRWWFDHHATAFQPATLRDDFEARRTDDMAFDPAAPSCAGLVTRVLAERHGWTPPAPLVELARWADIIDAAAFASAAEACSLSTPAQQLAMWLGAVRDPAAIARYIDELSRDGLDALAAAPWVRAVLDPALARRESDRERWAEIGRLVGHGDIVLFDLLDEDRPPPGFSGYDLFPDCTYTVTLGRTAHAVKVGVGWNPWGPTPRTHDLGALCERLGGGGHASVGGVTLARDDDHRARNVAAALVAGLAT
ncbi:MAG TPA: hypothetical protein VM261_31765 [Kofleriaceae bacterium]|nr:hypothetical protein [Kofleriaceae bacterium]